MSQLYTFSGSHCTGKSSLISKIEITYNAYPLDIEVMQSNSTSISALQDVMSLEEIQLEMIRREYSRVFISDNARDYITLYLKDRCILDVLAYSTLLHRSKKLSEAVYNINRIAASELIPYYDGIFILPISPNIPFVKRDKFSYPEETREEVSDIFLELLEEYHHFGNIHLLKGETLDARYDEVVQTIKRG